MGNPVFCKLASKVTVASLIFLLLLAVGANRANSDGPCHLGHLVNQWSGKYPVEGNRNFVMLPELKQRLTELIGKKYFERLSSLQTNPLYLMEPIKSYDRNLTLHFLPNPHLNDEDIRLFIVVGTVDCSLHAAFVHGDGKTRWRHVGVTTVPYKILKIFNLNSQ